jgi:trigger factor
MQVTTESLEPTKVKLTIIVDKKTLTDVKAEVLTHLAKDHVKIQGFRTGKAPLALVEKSVDQGLLQSEFLDGALNRAYGLALDQEKLRPVAQPEVNITKFVPFTTLEFTAEVEVVGKIKLPDYKKVKLAKKPVEVTVKDVEAVIDDLKLRVSEKKAVERAAKTGDEVVIDFAGVDAKTKEPIAGADGKAYPLQLGSNTFIPGFEDHIVGMKPSDEKTFDITFPKDYGVAALQSKKVTFTVTVHTVNELTQPKVDDAFAAKVGPFKKLTELKADIKKQVTAERQAQAERDYQNELIQKLAEKTTVDIPTALIENEMDRMEQDERQNLVYRGQTWQEHLKDEGVTEEEHRERQRPQAELRVKSGLMLGEIAEQEGVSVTAKELDDYMNRLRAQYTDPTMQAELEKPETRRDITSRIVSEKTIAKLTDYATK